MKKAIYIVGSGGHAKEVYFLLKEIGQYELKGFVDLLKKEPLQFSEREFRIITEEEFLLKETPDTTMLAIGIGEPKVIKAIAKRFNAFSFPNLIHPSVIYDKDNVKMGNGNIITAGVVLTTCINIGDMNVFNRLTTVGHDTIIGNYNVINPSACISGGVEIGSTNLIGAGATVLQYKKIGNNSVIGAAALVTKDVRDEIIVIGVPAKSV